MTALIFYLLKVILCSGSMFLYYRIALQNKSFHQWNRFYLLSTVFLSLLLPLCTFDLSAGTEQQKNALDLLRSYQGANHYLEEFVVISGSGFTQEQWLFFGYGLLSTMMLFSFLFSLLKVALIIQKHPRKKQEHAFLLETDIAGSPFSFFHFIFWNRQISLQSETGRRILQHELVHVKEKHSLDKVFLQVVLICFWCNPFFWLIRKELQNIHEFIADKKSVGQDNTDVFAAMLVESIYPQQFSSLTNSFFQTSLKRRIMMISKKQNFSYRSRILAIPAVLLLSAALTIHAAEEPLNRLQSVTTQSEISTKDTIPKKEISSVNVNKKEQTTTITLTYKNGSKETFTKEQAIQKGLLKDDEGKSSDTGKAGKSGPPPLFLVNGEEYNGNPNSIDPSTISSINVLKNKSALDKYGKKGENGVVEIMLKEGSTTSAATDSYVVFEKAEKPAQIDPQNWREFLEENTLPIISEISKQAPSGKYTVNVRFIVNKDGSLSDFTALNDPGYTIASKVLDLMKKAPKWEPAMQNGRLVRSYHTQPITFVITEGKSTR